MTNKDTKFIDPKEVIRNKDGKIDLFQTILARKDPTAQIPVILDPQPVTPVGTNSNNKTGSDATKSSSGSSSPTWRATHVTTAKPTTSPATSSTAYGPYAATTTTTTTASTTATTTNATTKDGFKLPATVVAKATVTTVVKKALWSDVFSGYCNDPRTIPESLRYWHDDNHVIIKDAFPKAKVHLLVMPRRPINKVTDLVGEAGIRTVEELVRVATTRLATLKKENPHLEFKTGFHIIPSMKRLHLHIISQDFCSASLKKAAHWNSFNTAYFIPPEEVIRVIRGKGSFAKTEAELQEYSRLKKEPLRCNQCSQVMRTMPMLSHHLREHYDRKMQGFEKKQH
ncbi:hypothetical protein BGX29_001290 [Mortierella sp. GBA35]|nr:hypothetical protein BGX29_001290 [Mortierella sp. GBA35]